MDVWMDGWLDGWMDEKRYLFTVALSIKLYKQFLLRKQIVQGLKG